MTHICISKIIVIGSDNGWSPGRYQAIIWTNAGIMSIGPLGINFSESDLTEIDTFPFKKIHLKLSSENGVYFVSALSRTKCFNMIAIFFFKYWHSWVYIISYHSFITWWRHQMEAFSALLAICAGNSPVHGEFPAQRPVTRSFDVFFDLSLNQRLSKPSLGWWYETLSRPLWRHCNEASTGFIL